MQIFRAAVFLLLVAAAVLLGLYLYTGDRRYRAWGVATLKWTVIAGLGFFAVLILERLAA